MQRRVAVVLVSGLLAAGLQAQDPAPAWSDEFGYWGLGGAVRAAAYFDEDGAGPQPPVLYVGGDFESDSGVRRLNYIARRKDGRWQSVAGGCDNVVQALLVMDEDGDGPQAPTLIVGGAFEQAGDASALHVARWDGRQWSSLGEGSDQVVTALAAYDEDHDGPLPPRIFAAKWYRGVARFDGTGWTVIGEPDYFAYALATCDLDGPGPGVEKLYVGGSFTSISGLAASRISAWDGATWSALGGGLNNAVRALAVWDADGSGPGLPVLVAGGEFANYAARWNGSAWAALSGLNGRVLALAAFDADSAGPGTPALFAGGAFSTHLARYTGSAWTSCAANGDVCALAASNSTLPTRAAPELAASGLFTQVNGVDTDFVATWNGAAWQSLGTRRDWGTDGTVMGLATFAPAQQAAPDLLIGGRFSRAGALAAMNIAAWDGVSHRALGAGLTVSADGAGVRQLTAWTDRPAGQPRLLIAAGDFTASGALALNRVGAWNGAQWSALGSGLAVTGYFGPVGAASATFDSDGAGPLTSSLYVGGYFGSAGGVTVKHIACWNGASWSSVGAGFNDRGVWPVIDDLLVFDEDDIGPQPPALFAAGSFCLPGSSTVYGVARWDGATWAPVGGAMTGYWVSDLEVFDEDGTGPQPPALFASGYFSGFGGVSAPRIARWDGVSWSPVGDGIAGTMIDSLCVFDADGDGPAPPALYAGGSGYASGGYWPVFAAWDGASWRAIPVGNVGAIYRLAIHDLDGAGPRLPVLVVGGSFQSTGGRPARSLALYGVNVPLRADLNCDGQIDFGDINPFVNALVDPPAYAAAYPLCPLVNGDVNRDGVTDFGDINPFVRALTGQ
jgi:trimeric autotransporter adhesin